MAPRTYVPCCLTSAPAFAFGAREYTADGGKFDKFDHPRHRECPPDRGKFDKFARP